MTARSNPINSCPFCFAVTAVIDSRGRSGAIRRRRMCKGPDHHRFTTYELIVDFDRIIPRIARDRLADFTAQMELLVNATLRRAFQDVFSTVEAEVASDRLVPAPSSGACPPPAREERFLPTRFNSYDYAYKCDHCSTTVVRRRPSVDKDRQEPHAGCARGGMLVLVGRA